MRLTVPRTLQARLHIGKLTCEPTAQSRRTGLSYVATPLQTVGRRPDPVHGRGPQARKAQSQAGRERLFWSINVRLDGWKQGIEARSSGGILSLTEKQRSALQHVYSDEYDLSLDDGCGDGHHPFTVRSLVKRGLLQADGTDLDALECSELTPTGLRALGVVRHPTPKRASTALRRALRALVPHLDDGDIHLGRRVERVCVEEGPYGNLYSDTTGVVGAVQYSATCLDDDDVLWSCVAKMATDMGHPMHASRIRHLVYFHTEEE